MRSIELQVAIPRTGQVGAIQNELQQKPIHDQTLLANDAAKRLEEQRKKSNEVDKSDEHLKAEQDGQSKHQHRHRGSGSSEEDGEQQRALEHPFKGHHIDLTL